MSRELPNLSGLEDPDSWEMTGIQFHLDHLKHQFSKSKDCAGNNDAHRGLSDAKSISSNNSRDDFQTFAPRRLRKKPIPQADCFAEGLFKKNKLGLKKVLKQQKIKAIINNFKKKLGRNLISSTPVQYEPFVREGNSGILYHQGFNLPNWLDLGLAFCSIIQILSLFFVYTLSLVFEQLIKSAFINNLQTFSMVFYTIQILINFLVIKTINGRKLLIFKDIGLNYMKKKFIVDVVCLGILIVDIGDSFSLTKYFRLCVVFKMGECLVKMEKIQNFFITNFYKEQYWALVKVFLINFGFAHILAILLIAMAALSDTHSWLHKLGAIHDPWYQQYVWAFYWGTTTMLTVGFGDLAPANYKQALCVTLIETFSCILLAYNINCVGTLISNIRSQDVERNKNLKIMRRLAQENNIHQDLQWQVCNYINQSDKMRKKFQFQTDRTFIASLPEELKGQYLKQANIKIFKNLGFFKSLTEKTLLALAEQIEVSIAHPEEIVFKGGDIGEFMILRNGKVGYLAKIPDGEFHHTVIDVLKVEKDDSPRFLHLNFLTGNNCPKYDIKSLGYSMISSLSMERLINILKGSPCDYENFCQMKDKSKHIPDQYEILDCELCQGKHSKMGCPKIHYQPYQQLVIARYLSSVKIGRCSRQPHLRYNKNTPHFWKPLKKYSEDYKNCQIMIYGKKTLDFISRKSIKDAVERQKTISEALIPEQKTDPSVEISHSIIGGLSDVSGKKYEQLSTSDKDGKRVNEFLQGIQEKWLSMIRSNQDKATKNEYGMNDMEEEVDMMHNFNYYFSRQNPAHLVSFPLKKKYVRKQGRGNKELNQSNIMSDLSRSEMGINL